MIDKRDLTCCFTGHRTIPPHHLDIVRARTEIAIRDLIVNHGVRYFGVGGALGYDTLVADILFRLRDTEFRQIRVILVYPFDGYTNRWTAAQQANHVRMLPQYDKRVCVAQIGSREAYFARNRHLVDGSAYCICYCARDASGTAYTVNYAKHRKLEVINVCPDSHI